MRRWRVRQPGLQQSACRRRRTCHYPCQCFVGASQAGETRGEDREFGAAHATADRAGLPAGSSGADQAGEKGKDLIAPGCPGVDTVTVMLRHDQTDGGGTHRFPGEAVEWPAQFHQARPFILEYLPDCPAVELRLVGSPRAGDARLFPPGVQLGQALHPGLGAEQQIAQIAGLVLNLAVRATHAAFGHGSPEPQPEAGGRLDQNGAGTLAASRECTGAPCQRRSHRPRSSCCRRGRGGKHCRGTGPLWRGRSWPRFHRPCRWNASGGVENQCPGLAEGGAHQRHPAVRPFPVRRLDGRRQALERDRRVAQSNRYASPRAKLSGTNAGAATRDRSFRHALANRCTLSRASGQASEGPPWPCPRNSSNSRRADRRSRRASVASFATIWFRTSTVTAQSGRRLNPRLIPEPGGLAADHLAHRCL
jgi:hypothetical protein